MRLSVASGDSTAVQTELHVQILDADVVNQLIETTLQERRIDRANRFQTFARHACCESDAVLLSNTNVKRTIGKFLESGANSRSIRHRRSQRDHLRILFHQFRKRVAKYFRVGRGFRTALHRFAGREIEWTGSMPAIV